MRRSANWLCLAAALVVILTQVGRAEPTGNQTVVGCWKCEMEGEISLMEFRADNTAIIDGESSPYELTDQVIRMTSDLGPMDYPYVVEGNTLTLIFMGLIQIPCTRIKCGEQPQSQTERRPGAEEEQATPVPRETRASGNEYQLRGMFCHWSGSSSSYSGSGYSHSLRVSFDGQGRFSTGSESSFGSNEGIAYGTGDASGGTYRLVGNEVHLNFNDGSTGVATVELRESDGTVTALKYNGDLYAPQLCD